MLFVRVGGDSGVKGSFRFGTCSIRPSVGAVLVQEEGTMAEPDRVGYWNRTRNLMFVMMGLWLFFSFIIHLFVDSLNNIVILGFPLGFYMAAQGSLIAFVIMLFWFARKQNSIDEECGMAED
jgi:putative solute:sodium symporter small subunit